MILMKLLAPFIAAVLLTLFVSIAPQEPLQAAGPSCHQDQGAGSYCNAVCGYEGTRVCTYMECGNGTEICMRRSNIVFA